MWSVFGSLIIYLNHNTFYVLLDIKLTGIFNYPMLLLPCIPNNTYKLNICLLYLWYICQVKKLVLLSKNKMHYNGIYQVKFITWQHILFEIKEIYMITSTCLVYIVIIVYKHFWFGIYMVVYPCSPFDLPHFLSLPPPQPASCIYAIS